MKKLIVSLVLCLMMTQLFAGDFSITGRLVDAEGEGLPNTTVLLLDAADSTMVSYAMSDREGHFSIHQVKRDNYLLRITFVGFATRILPVDPPGGEVLEMGEILMEEAQTVLGEVTVEGQRVAMAIRGDTIEYDALAFGARPSEVVEDMLKRMPGIEVDPDGTIRAQGEQVRRVLVDGREFFGRDPQMATQNLPADAVSRIHVFDERSEQSQFTGIDDGERERTMNLELKEDRRQGMFGNTSLGYGPDDRYQGSTNVNRFNEDGQVSVLGMGNNLNQQGFSIADYMNFSGGIQGVMGGGMRIGGAGGAGIPLNTTGRPGSNGIMTSLAGGVNANRTFRDDTEITASYFYNQLDHDVTQDLERENFMPGGSYDFMQQSSQENENRNHRANLRLDHSFSDDSSVLLTFSGRMNDSRSNRYNDSKTYRVNGMLQNTSEQLNIADGQSLDIQSGLLWRQRLSRPGRTLTARLDLSVNGGDQHISMEGVNRFYQEAVTEVLILQDNIQENSQRTASANFTYTEPLRNSRFLEFNYRLTHTRNEADQQVFDITDGDRMLNELLTNIYSNTHVSHRGGINLMVNGESYSLTVGGYAQSTSLEGEQILHDDPLREGFFHLLPLARFNYEFTSFRRLSVDFQGSVQEPRMQQLQPIVDNRDPLNIYEGNPDLEPSYRNRLNIRFNSFNPLNSFGFFAFASADYVRDAITNAVQMDDAGVRTVMPVNTANNLNLTANTNVNFQLNRLKSRVMLGSTLTRMESTNILNALEQRITNQMINGSLRYSFRPADSFETNLSASLNRQLTEYEFSTLEQAYLNQTYGADLSWRFLEHYRLEGEFRYQIYEGRTSEFDQKIPMLEFGFSRRFLRNNSGELKLSGFNLLDKDLGVSQRVDANFLEQQVTNSLGRYFLLSFTYSLNSSLNVFEGAGRGGMIRMHR